MSAAPCTQRWSIAPSAALAAPSSDNPADLAWLEAAMAGRAQWMEWIETNLHRSSVDVLSRLPHDDAIKLASLVTTEQISWSGINAALRAKIKLAAAEELNRHRERCEPAPQSRRQAYDSWAAYDNWDEAKRNGESEIRARYDAKCDDVFGNEPGPVGTGPRAIERVLGRERILDDLRIARDDELAELTRRLGPEPVRPTSSARPRFYQLAMLTFRLTPAEISAKSELDAAGFDCSADMTTLIDTLASEIAGDIARVTWVRFPALEAENRSA